MAKVVKFDLEGTPSGGCFSLCKSDRCSKNRVVLRNS